MIPQAIFGAAVLLGAGSSLFGAKQQSTEAKYNARLKEQEAKNIDIAKDLTARQWDRQIGKLSGAAIANMGSSGLAMTGSPINALIDSMTQMELDKQVELFNLESQKSRSISESQAYRRQAKTAMYAGAGQAFSSLLKGGYEYYKEF